MRWLDSSDFYNEDGGYRDVPDPDCDPTLQVLEWQMQPGDAVIFDYRTVQRCPRQRCVDSEARVVFAVGG